MDSELEDVLRERLGSLAPTVIEIQKRKLGLRGEEVPDDIREDFVRGLVFTCQNEVDIEVDSHLQERMKHSLK